MFHFLFGTKLKTISPPFPFYLFILAVIIFIIFIIFIIYSQMLLSNRFLTGHDVAQVLLHYEDLVGMAFW